MTLDSLRSHILALPDLAKFAIAMVAIVGSQPLAKRLRIPTMVPLLLFGVALGPHALGLFGSDHPIAKFFGELGKLLLMFSAGLEVDLSLLHKTRNRTLTFGVVTTTVPLILGTLFALSVHYATIPAIVIGSLLASHTLLSLPIVTRLGVVNLEPVVVSIGATVMSDTLSLIVFAICVSSYTTGFSTSKLLIQLAEIAVFVPLIVFGVGRGGGYLLRKVQGQEETHFMLLFGIMALAGLLANLINLPAIVGAFLAGLSINTAVQGQPAKERLGFFGNAMFIPGFFIVTGLLIDPSTFISDLIHHFGLVAGIVGSLLVGKYIAAEGTGRAFGYSAAAQRTMWAMTLPQVAATLAAATVAHQTFNHAHQVMLDDTTLNAVLVLMLVTSILGPLLTERFAPQMKQPV